MNWIDHGQCKMKFFRQKTLSNGNHWDCLVDLQSVSLECWHLDGAILYLNLEQLRS